MVTQPADEPSTLEAEAEDVEAVHVAPEVQAEQDRFVATAEPSPANVAEPGEEWPALEAVAPLPAAVAEEVAEAGGPADSEETPVTEAPAAAKRFASRTNRSARTKAGRRGSGSGAKSRKIVGLKIGASQIAASVVTQTDAGYELLELARRPLADGIVVDGEVRDEDALVTAVKAFFDEEKLPRNDVRIGLSSNRIGVRTIDIVGSDDETQVRQRRSVQGARGACRSP